MTDKISRLLLPLTLVLVLLAGPAQTAQLLDRIVAVAGDSAVMLSELRDKARQLLSELQAQRTNPMPSEQQIINSALDDLILEKLQLAEAQRLGISVDAETVSRAVAQIAANNGLTLQQLAQTLAAEDMSMQAFENRIRDQLLVSRLINQEVTNRIQVSTSEIEQYLARQDAAPDQRREVHLMHILIATRDGATPAQIRAAAQKAEATEKRLRGGEDFARVAQQVSDASNAIQGGDLGWAKMGQLTQSMAEQVSRAAPGDIIGPIRSNAGFHLIKVAAFRGGSEERKIVAQTQARHILIRTDEVTSDDDARTRLEQLRDRIQGGDDFATLARANSQDPGSAIKGGDLGWVSPGSMVEDFENEMDKLPVGAISRPFKTRFGWHIVQVLARRDHDETLEARRLAAKKAIRDRKADEATAQYLRRLRDEAFVDVRPDDIE